MYPPQTTIHNPASRVYWMWAAILFVMYFFKLPRKQQAMMAQHPNAIETSQTYFSDSA